MIVAILGIVFFIVNCSFALILLVLLIIVSIYAVVSENPDILHEQMEDDRSEFIKSKTNFSDVELNLSDKKDIGSNFKEVPTIKDPLSSYDGTYSTNKINKNTNFHESEKFPTSHNFITKYISRNLLTVPPRPPFKSNMRPSNDFLRDFQSNKENRDNEYISYQESDMNSYFPKHKQSSNIEKSDFVGHDSHTMLFSDSQSRQYIPGAPKKTRNYGLYHNTYTNKTA